MVLDFLIIQVVMAEVYYVGVDVGTASVRAALVSRSGLLKSIAQEPISIWEPHTDHYVQSSTEIWEKCCTVVKVWCTIKLKVIQLEKETYHINVHCITGGQMITFYNI